MLNIVGIGDPVIPEDPEPFFADIKKGQGHHQPCPFQNFQL